MIQAKHRDGRTRSFTEVSWAKLSNEQKTEWSTEPSEVKNHNGRFVPPNPMDIGKSETTPTISSQMTVADATIEIISISVQEKLDAFVLGDERKGILNAYAKRSEELTK